jgi:surface antigen
LAAATFALFPAATSGSVHRSERMFAGLGWSFSSKDADGDIPVRMTMRSLQEARCVLTVHAGTKQEAFPTLVVNSEGRAGYSWLIPSAAPKGEWKFSVSCRKFGETADHTAHINVETGGGHGPLVQPSTAKIIAGREPAPGEAEPVRETCVKEWDDGDREPDTEGSGTGDADVPQTESVCFKNNPYSPGQCTWYAHGRRPDIPRGGHARTWLADNKGLLPEGTKPVVGAIAVWAPGQGGSGDYGHVAYVSGVSSDGKTITIDEANYNRPLEVHYGRDVNASTVEGYIYGGPAGDGPKQR